MKTQTAIDHFGGRQQLADALDIRREATYVWGEYVPYLRQCQIQIITAGKLVASAPGPRHQVAA